jgi:capsular exopolysaccharide synthesis family protein
LELRTELQRSEASATAAVLAEQAASVRKRLETAEDSLESFQTRNQLVAVADQVTEEVQALAALRVQREQLDAERVALTELVDAIGSNAQDSMRLRDVASFPTFLQNPVVSDLMSTLLELETERRELTLRRSEVNPDVVAIDQQIREVENQLRDYAVSYERALIAQVSALDRPLVAASDRLRTLPTQQVQLARLERQVTLLSNLFQYLESRRREAEVAEAVDLPSIRVVDSASQPTSPSWPSVPLLTVLGMAFGLAAGLGLAILRDWSDDRLYERSEVEADLGLQVIGLIPRIQKDRVVVPVNGRSTKLMPSRSFANRKTDSTAQADERERGQDTRQRADARIVQWSPGFEAFRSLMTDVRLLWPLKEHEQVRSIAVTSAGTGEGKTVIACNLAMAFAFQNERTILVDADLRARGASRAFGLASRPGLSDYLNGEVGIDEVMVNAAVGLGDLLVFPAGSTASLDSSAHLQASVAQLLKELGRRSEILIVDAPPLNVLADASSVSAAVDVVLVVIRSGVTTRESVQLTIDRLRRSGASQVGLILNDAPLPKQYASYSKNYHYREAGKGIIREDATP